jgi:hypothetical protein
VIDLRHRSRRLCFETDSACARSRAASNTADTRVSTCMNLGQRAGEVEKSNDGPN